MIPEKILPTLDKLYDEFRNLGVALNAKIEKLQIAVSTQNDQDIYEELTSMSNLRECVRAAADVVSIASSTLTVDVSDKKSIKHGSDFGDLFVQDTNETMMRWMSSNTVYEYEEMSPLPDPSETSTGDARTEYPSDSDSDLESDIFKALFNSAKKLMEEGDLIGAERKLCNCLARLNGNASTYSLRSAAMNEISKAELLERLIEVYCLLRSWTKAKTTMLEKLSVTERRVGKKDELYLTDLLKLAEIMMQNREYVEAHLQGRRSLRGFKKLGESGFDGYEKSLVFLIHLCNAEDKADEEEAYAALLGSHRATRKPTPCSRIDLDRPAISTPPDPEISLVEDALDALYLAAGQPTTSRRRDNNHPARDKHLAAEHVKAEVNTQEPIMANSKAEIEGMSILSKHDTHISAATERSDTTNPYAARDEDLTELAVIEIPASMESHPEGQIEVMMSMRDGSETGQSPPGTTTTSVPQSPTAEATSDATEPHQPQVQTIQHQPMGAGVSNSPTQSILTRENSSHGVASCDDESSHTESAKPAKVPDVFRPQLLEKQESAPMDDTETLQETQGSSALVRFANRHTVTNTTGSVENWLGDWFFGRKVARGLGSQYWNGSVDLGIKRNHPGSQFDLLSTFCRLRYGIVPYHTCMWNHHEGWSCSVVLECTKQTWKVVGKPRLRIATEDAVALACKDLISPYTEELIVSGTRLRDPCSDKEVVAPGTERSWNASLVPKRPSLVASSSSGVPLITVSSDQQESGWSAMFGRLLRRSGSDSRLPRNHAIETPYVRDAGGEPSNTSSERRRAVTLYDRELERYRDLGMASDEAMNSGEAGYAEKPTCPICNESLVGLYEISKSTHVNSCIDGVPIPISQLRSKDEVSPTTPTPEGPVPVDNLSAPKGTWACGNCKSHRLQSLGENICTSCGGRRGVGHPSSTNDFTLQPFERHQDLFKGRRLYNVTTANGNFMRCKILLLGDTLCGKTWLAR